MFLSPPRPLVVKPSVLQLQQFGISSHLVSDNHHLLVPSNVISKLIYLPSPASPFSHPATPAPPTRACLNLCATQIFNNNNNNNNNCICIGNHVRCPKNPTSPDAVVHVPFTLFPSPVVRSCFEKACKVQTDFNLLMHRVANDPEFLEHCLERYYDCFLPRSAKMPQVKVLPKLLHIGSRKQCHTIGL